MNHLPDILKESVRFRALSLGFDACAFAEAAFMEPEARHLERWLNEGRHGTMGWMEGHFDLRTDPRLLVPGAKTVISVLLSYNQPDIRAEDGSATDRPRVSQYAQGEDYHRVMWDKLEALMAFIRETVGPVEGRGFTDSAPVMDKAWARRSGLGWQGKNGNLLDRDLGSFFFIGELIVDAAFSPDPPTTDHCGTCTRCIDACPTGAIIADQVVDATRCISYLTIELREAIPAEYHRMMGNWMYGCDICQDVCPWNRKAKAGTEPRLMARPELRAADAAFWAGLDEPTYREVFRGSAMKRTKLGGLKRNAEIVLRNLETP